MLGFQDECWWSRLAQPHLHSWVADEPLHLVERDADRTDPDPKAAACYGLLRADTGGMLLRFVQGRPVSQVTEDFLAWVCQRLAAEGKQALHCWSGITPPGTSASECGPGSRRTTRG